MEIHRPKAAHSWREFAIEIGTIICGILIALGFEQAVEFVHQRAEIREAREALKEEVSEDLDNLRYSLVENSCLQPQYANYVSWAKGGPKPPPLRANLIGLYSSSWDTVKARAVPLMPLRERLALGSFYDLVEGERRITAELRSNALMLEALYAHSKLNEVDAGRLLETATASQRLSVTQAGVLKYALARSADTGVSMPQKDARELAAEHWVCTGAGNNPITGEH